MPKEPQLTQIQCKNEELKCILISLISKIRTKIYVDNDWTIEDYTKFRNQLAKMDVETFITVFNEMLLFLDLSKKDLEITLKKLDERLNTHVFDSERVLTTIMDSKTQEMIPKYEFFPHHFETSDLVSFLQKLISVIHKYDSVTINYYNTKLKSNGTIDEEQEKIKLLLEMLDDENSDMIDIIKKEYEGLSKRISPDEIVLGLIEKMLELVIQNNKSSLKDEFNKLSIRRMTPYNSYTEDGKRDYFTQKEKAYIKMRSTK